MDDYSWVGPAISAAGNIGAGLIGGGKSSDGFSQKGSNQALMHNLKANPMLMNSRINSVKKLGKKYGIHPLTLLGIPPSQGPSTMVGSGSGKGDPGIGNALDRMGQDITRAQMARQTPEEKQLTDLAIRQEAAKANLAEGEAEIMRRKLADLDKEPQAPELYDDNYNVTPVRVPSKSAPGTEAGNPAAMRQIEYPSNNPETLATYESYPSESIQDTVSEGMYYQIKHAIKEIGGSRHISWNHTFPVGKSKFFKKLRKQKNQMFKTVLKPGIDVRWNPTWHRWEKVKMGKEGRKLYTHANFVGVWK